jgi:fructosamine-3-kinase
MRVAAQRDIEHALGARIAGVRPVGGGDINEAWALSLDDGRTLFAKTNTGADRMMFEAEAKGLVWLVEARALRVPEVIAVSSPTSTQAPFLVLEMVHSASPKRAFDEELGRGLAALHRSGAESFGLDHDNFIGPLPQSNRIARDWATFYGAERLEPQLVRARQNGRVTPKLERLFETLFTKLSELIGPAEPPARLHGDLWGGNLMVDERGAPCLVDPAVYGGHREVDLAMMKLFGGFGARVFDAYREAYPLSPGSERRVALYQLYPLLVHLNLFGESYRGRVESTLGSLV